MDQGQHFTNCLDKAAAVIRTWPWGADYTRSVKRISSQGKLSHSTQPSATAPVPTSCYTLLAVVRFLRLPLLLSEPYDYHLVLDSAVPHPVWKHGKEMFLPYLLVYKTLKELCVFFHTLSSWSKIWFLGQEGMKPLRFVRQQMWRMTLPTFPQQLRCSGRPMHNVSLVLACQWRKMWVLSAAIMAGSKHVQRQYPWEYEWVWPRKANPALELPSVNH